MPARPCVSHGACWAIHVFGLRAAGGDRRVRRHDVRRASVAAADGRTFAAAAASDEQRDSIGGHLPYTIAAASTPLGLKQPPGPPARRIARTRPKSSGA